MDGNGVPERDRFQRREVGLGALESLWTNPSQPQVPVLLARHKSCHESNVARGDVSYTGQTQRGYVPSNWSSSRRLTDQVTVFRCTPTVTDTSTSL